MSLRAVLFDVDGTLADTEALGHRPAYNHAFRKLGLDLRWDAELYRELLKQPGGRERLKHFVQHYRPCLGDQQPRTEAELDAWVAKVHALKSHYFRQRMRQGEVPLRPGIARLMREARIQGLRLAIVTNASLKTLKPVLQYSMGPELSAEIEVIASGEEVTHKKPAADVYCLALRRLGLSARDCVALEDSEMGLRAATAAGVAAIVTINSDTVDQNFSSAALVVSSLGEPGAPARVLRGGALTPPWVTLKTLQDIAAQRAGAEGGAGDACASASSPLLAHSGEATPCRF
ncbi:HAD-IA family hydrolase [Sinimarinibacterium sp. NLF-5-8]|uniref:HAD-IA family hydrolase n=1 Tax=Sinimarinibacterium sp. NLF-5-8 TaxID=2698684 RepID=UPI00137BB615|nr:HAD-IA family hydrolase [Sinimarinibacterium sp. NLF-5-8]QHS09878.1 HAD-IA family hydrolase [Sinimarinibacterium sp. NLF-5-8]